MPQAHSRSPCPGSPADKDRHAAHIVPPCCQRIDQSHDVEERPDLAAMRVAAEHQSHVSTRGALSEPRRMRYQDGRTRGPTGQRAIDRPRALLTTPMARGKVIQSRQDESRTHFRPLVAQDVNPRFLQESPTSMGRVIGGSV